MQALASGCSLSTTGAPPGWERRTYEPCWAGQTSLGRSNELVKSRVGDMDVADVHRARELCLERMPHLDPDKVPFKSTTWIGALKPFKSTTCTGSLKLPAGGSDGWLAWRLSGDPSGRATPRQLQGGCCKEPSHQHCKVCLYYVINRVFGRARLPS